jgi:hypothetical protein
MSDLVVLDGDLAQFLPGFGMATVVVRPGTMRGSGPATKAGKRFCLVGDEAQLQVPGCVYFTPQHSIPGVGTLSISALAADQQSGTTTHKSTKLILVGSQFQAKLTVTMPAMQPPPAPGSPIPDSRPDYTGQGSFVTANTNFKVA